MKRREFLQGLSLLSANCMVPRAFANYFPYSANYQGQIGPVTVVDSLSTQDFTGDRPDFPHEYLWAKFKYDDRIAALKPTSSQDVVIVGGGIGGLVSAYTIKDKNVTLIEMDPMLGGNSKGEVIGNQAFSIGAAYTTVPSEGSLMFNLLQDLGLGDKGRVEEGTSVYYQDKVRSDFWNGDTDPQNREAFRAFHAHMKKIVAESYPDIMSDSPEVMALDQLTFLQWLNQNYPNLHPHIMEYMQLYAWSSFCGGIDEVSAAQMIGFIASETQGILCFPGGNATIAHAMYQRIAQDPRKTLMTHKLVIDVRAEKNYTKVTYVDMNGNFTAIKADKVIMSCAKFIAERIVYDMPEDQKAAISMLLYRAYIVANVFVESKQRSPAYEMYCLKGNTPPNPTPRNLHPRPFTDICFGSWSAHDPGPYQILTVYKGIALDGARQFLFNPGIHDSYRNMILKEVQDIFKQSNTQGEIKGIRMTRWGHALPLAQAGLMAKGTFQLINRPINNSIFFANQDNWCNPCFESAAYGAMDALKLAKLI